MRLLVPFILRSASVNQSQAVPTEPPSFCEESFPAATFGYGTSRYALFLETLLEGLLEYEGRARGGGDHAPTPLPAA